MEVVTRYSRRVLFNNLQADEDPASKFYLYSMDEPAPQTQDLEVSKMFGNYTLGPRKRLRLPDPPLKLILKNTLSAAQLQHNLQHSLLPGVSYHGDLNDMALFPPELVPRLELARVINPEGAVEDSEEDSDGDEKPMPLARRKLYLDMTPEELMALDPQFAKPKTSNLDNFKFDSKQTFYLPSSRRASNSAPGTSGAKQIIYPSLNENNYQLISLTMKHCDFDHNLLTTRTLLTVVSGRKHSWNTLDWLLLTDKLVDAPVFLQDGDYLVVAALIPLKYFGNKKRSDDKLYQKCDALLAYIMENLPDPTLRLKITVEFVIDVSPADPMTLSKKPRPTGTKFMMSHLYKQYMPTLVVLGNKLTNLNFKYPIRRSKQLASTSASTSLVKLPLQLALAAADAEASHFLIKLSSYLVKYSTVPVIFVGNSTKFHHRIVPKQLVLVTFSDDIPNPQKSILDAQPPRKNLATSEASIESFSGNLDSGSATLDDNIKQKMDELSASQSITRFAEMAACVSDNSLAQLRLYIGIITNDNIEKLSSDLLGSKVHQAYLSSSQSRNGSVVAARTNSNGGAGNVYKVKSLISYSEEEEKKNERLINDKKLKKTLSRGLVSSALADEKLKKKKSSFFLKIGLKKS